MTMYRDFTQTQYLLLPMERLLKLQESELNVKLFF